MLSMKNNYMKVFKGKDFVVTEAKINVLKILEL